MLKYIGPVLAALGILFVLVFQAGSGLDAPGFWLIPIGAIISTVTIIVRDKKVSWALIISVVLWILAFLSIAGLNGGWFTDPDSFDGLIWMLPAIGFTFAGLIASTVGVSRK